MKEKLLKNMSWIVCCKIVQSLLGFIIGVVTARYLGPSGFGLVSYASSIAAFFIPIMQLGLNSILVQEFINNPKEEGKILGTSLVSNICAALVSVIGITSFAMVANYDDAETILVCFLYSLTLIFKACEMTHYWFQARFQSKYPSIVALLAYAIATIYKIYILVTGKSIHWFAITHVIEAAIIAALLLIIYRRLGGQHLRFSWKYAKHMLDRSKYYVSSGLIMVAFQQIDRIMLNLIEGKSEAGYYSAALTCVGITAFFFGAIIDSARPAILEEGISEKQLENRLTMLLSTVGILSLLQSIGMSLFSGIIIGILFGNEFMPAIRVLQILVWYSTFGYYGMVRDIWILAKGKQKYLWRINLTGALINVSVNYLLIPIFGASGAACATVITQLLMNCILCFVFKPIRPVGRMIALSLSPKNMVNLVQKYIK